MIILNFDCYKYGSFQHTDSMEFEHKEALTDWIAEQLEVDRKQALMDLAMAEIYDYEVESPKWVMKFNFEGNNYTFTLDI